VQKGIIRYGIGGLGEEMGGPIARRLVWRAEEHAAWRVRWWQNGKRARRREIRHPAGSEVCWRAREGPLAHAGLHAHMKLLP
jgi:hypothetical protein